MEHVLQNVRRRLSYKMIVNKMRRTFKQVIYDASWRLWEDIRSAKWVIIFIIAYFAFMHRFLYSLCPLVTITGYPCPGCGMTRAAFCLLHLDFAEAFELHPFVYVLAGYTVIFAWNRYIRLQKAGKFLKGAAILIIIAMILFYIWRMKMYYPGNPPMSYYSRNLIARVLWIFDNN